MTYLNFILLAYIVSVVCSYLLLKHTLIDLEKGNWTYGDRVVAIFFSLIPIAGICTTLFMFSCSVSKEYWNKECKW